MHSSLYKRMSVPPWRLFWLTGKHSEAWPLRSVSLCRSRSPVLLYADADVSSDNGASNSNDQTAEVGTLQAALVELRCQLRRLEC